MDTNKLDWKQWNEQGLIPGPGETQEEFIKRVQFCQNLSNELKVKSHNQPPFDLTATASENIYEDAFHLSYKLHGITPWWVPIVFSNYQLSTWHGGCAWIFQLDKDTPTSGFLQLRKNFQNRCWYMGIYNRRELIVHELAHVGRMLYQEPVFEEILAYRSSDSKFRRYFGPIVQSSSESLLFTILLGLVLIADLILLFFNIPFASTIALWLLILPFTLLILAIIRIIKRQAQFHNCLKNLKKIYKSHKIAKHFIYRLTDKEIILFSKMKPSEIATYIQSHHFSSFRWEFLYYNYPIPKAEQ